MKDLNGVEKLSRKDLKNVLGGTRVPPANCSCFCVIGSEVQSHSCFTFCPGGVIPGENPGSGPGCGPPTLH